MNVKLLMNDVAVAVGVLEGIAVNVGEAVAVGVLVGVGEGPNVGVGVLVGVFVGTPVAEGVAVLINWVSITSCGALAPVSRLERLKAVLLVVVRAKLTSPLLLISGVTSTVVQTPVPKAPEEPITSPKAGELVKLMANSPHELSVRLRTW